MMFRVSNSIDLFIVTGVNMPRNPTPNLVARRDDFAGGPLGYFPNNPNPYEGILFKKY